MADTVDFNQDLNGDGGIGLTAALQDVTTDISGARLKRDGEQGLYIDVNNDGSNIIAIVDQWGVTQGLITATAGLTPIAELQDPRLRNRLCCNAKQDDGTFQLAVKSTDTFNGTATTNWNTYTISSSGVLDWSNSTLSGITKHEEKFNQDLNGDSTIGLSSTSLTASSGDTTGAILKKDSENGLYIDVTGDGQTLLNIVDNYGNSPYFDNSENWYDGSIHKSPSLLNNNLMAPSSPIQKHQYLQRHYRNSLGRLHR